MNELVETSICKIILTDIREGSMRILSYINNLKFTQQFQMVTMLFNEIYATEIKL